MNESANERAKGVCQGSLVAGIAFCLTFPTLDLLFQLGTFDRTILSVMTAGLFAVLVVVTLYPFGRIDWKAVRSLALGATFLLINYSTARHVHGVMPAEIASECEAGNADKCLEQALWERESGTQLRYLSFVNSACILGNNDACLMGIEVRWLRPALLRSLYSKLCERKVTRACSLFADATREP
ncbi:MAG: hypothetical protein U0136_22195 [Bdellovibrionota bacterium]